MDDEPMALRALEQALRSAVPDAEIACCTTSNEAIALAERSPLDVAFLDIETDQLGGIELARRLKEIDARTGIVFATAYSQYAVEAFSLHASGYLLKPITAEAVAKELRHLGAPIAPVPRQALLCIKTFGNFEVLHNGRPLSFPRSKAKEMLAYLVHKRGTGCTVRELASVLFEDRAYTLSIQRQMQTIKSTLNSTLKSVGAQDVIVKNYNSLAIDVNAVDCDYYRFLEGDPAAVNAYAGEYLSNYSWAEFVVGYLDRRMH
ncbi:response regulator [Arabiibacter massiliensis]|uniref:response regulator n=1 Tax=Arabiibacter massiliensis TaxID=1870985 RepID=UPI0009BC3BA4|nr:response regulator [Arabiibacter massiliensis]